MRFCSINCVVPAVLASFLLFCQTVTEDPLPTSYSLDKESVWFNAVWKSPVPGTRPLTLSVEGAMPQTLTFSVQYPTNESDWFQAATTRDGQSLVISNNVTPEALPPGTYDATVTLTAEDDPGLNLSYTVHLKVHACSLFVLAVPVAGWEDSVDAVTQASDVLGGARVSVTQVPDPSDSVKDVVVSFGDGTEKS